MSKSSKLSKKPSRRQAAAWLAIGGWVGSSITVIQGLLLIPMYISFLGDRLYGFWLASGGVLTLISMIDAGATGITKLRCAAAYGRNDFSGVSSYFIHGAVVAGVIATFYGAFIGATSLVIVDWINADEQWHGILTGCFLLAGLGAIFQFIGFFLRGFAVGLQRTQVPVIAEIIGNLVGLLSIVVGLYLGWGLWALGVGAVVRPLLPFLVNGVYAAFLLRKVGYYSGWSRAVFYDYLRNTPAVLGAKASGKLTEALPVLILTRWLGPEVTVAYTVTFRALQILRVFINKGIDSLYGAAGHFFADSNVSPEARNRLVFDLVRVFMVGCTGIFLIYTMTNRGFVSLWISPDLFAGQNVTVFLALGTFVLMGNRLLETFGMALGAIQSTCVVSIIERLARSLLLFLLIAWMGVLGVPLAMLVTSVFAAPAYAFIIRRNKGEVASGTTPLVWVWIPVAGILGCGSAIASVFDVETWTGWIVRAGIAALLVSLVCWCLLPELRSMKWLRSKRDISAPAVGVIR